MKKYLIAPLLALSCTVLGFENLPDPYLVKYGSPQAPLSIVQYFSFTCPHCVAQFRTLFQQIKESYIDTGKISWIFHPVPMDLLTVQGMDCLSKLPERERKIFLEAILEELSFDQPKLTVQLMQKGMDLLGKPIKDLQDKGYLSESAAFQDAFQFLKQGGELEAVPSVEVNGKFISAQIPDIEFIEEHLSHLRGHS